MYINLFKVFIIFKIVLIIINSLYTRRRKIHKTFIDICEEVFNSPQLNCTYVS